MLADGRIVGLVNEVEHNRLMRNRTMAIWQAQHSHRFAAWRVDGGYSMPTRLQEVLGVSLAIAHDAALRRKERDARRTRWKLARRARLQA